MPESPQRSRIVIAGGGTGGHVLPAIAVLEELERRDQPAEFLWIGSSTGLEREQAALRSIPFVIIRTGKLRRYIDLATIPDTARIPVGTAQARRVLRKFWPHVVFSTGGFVSVPTVVASWRLAPAITHEQTATLGLANRINSRFARTIALSYEDTAEMSGLPKSRIAVTGNPVRSSLATGDAARAFERFDLDPTQPLLFITGGARGASPLNARVEAVLSQLLNVTQIIHQTGPTEVNNDFLRLTALRDAFSSEQQKRYRVLEFVGDEINDVYAASSLVLSRSGGGTIAELAWLGKPSILIPLPGSGGGEQQLNAAVLGRLGGAIVIDQADATPERLLAEVTDLIQDPVRREEMGRQARLAAVPDAASKLTDLILDLAEHTRKKRGD